MNEVLDFFSSNTTVAYVTAAIIFIITIILLVKRIIGFVITLVLLAFALLSGLAIANNDLFRQMLSDFKYNPEKTKEDKTTFYKNQLKKAYEEVKEELGEDAAKIEAWYESYKKKQETEKKEPEKKETEKKP